MIMREQIMIDKSLRGSLPDKISDIKYDNGNENRNPQKKTENILAIQAFFWKRNVTMGKL